MAISWDRVTIEDITTGPLLTPFDVAARRMFNGTSELATRDRSRYGKFDDMPEGLKQWWYDAARVSTTPE